eukprot:Rhum_TRINITY_DN21031_c0_g1::Rhum_TRINITY_DN21031_c0_g1_i1::g.172828::m.172828
MARLGRVDGANVEGFRLSQPLRHLGALLDLHAAVSVGAPLHVELGVAVVLCVSGNRPCLDVVLTPEGKRIAPPLPDVLRILALLLVDGLEERLPDEDAGLLPVPVLGRVRNGAAIFGAVQHGDVALARLVQPVGVAPHREPRRLEEAVHELLVVVVEPLPPHAQPAVLVVVLHGQPLRAPLLAEVVQNVQEQLNVRTQRERPPLHKRLVVRTPPADVVEAVGRGLVLHDQRGRVARQAVPHRVQLCAQLVQVRGAEQLFAQRLLPGWLVGHRADHPRERFLLHLLQRIRCLCILVEGVVLHGRLHRWPVLAQLHRVVVLDEAAVLGCVLHRVDVHHGRCVVDAVGTVDQLPALHLLLLQICQVHGGNPGVRPRGVVLPLVVQVCLPLLLLHLQGALLLVHHRGRSRRRLGGCGVGHRRRSGTGAAPAADDGGDTAAPHGGQAGGGGSGSLHLKREAPLLSPMKYRYCSFY